jgi:hypothetical protein
MDVSQRQLRQVRPAFGYRRALGTTGYVVCRAWIHACTSIIYIHGYIGTQVAEVVGVGIIRLTSAPLGLDRGLGVVCALIWMSRVQRGGI